MKEQTMPQDRLWWYINYWVVNILEDIRSGYIKRGDRTSFSMSAFAHLHEINGMAYILESCGLITTTERDDVIELISGVTEELIDYTFGKDLFVEKEAA